MRVKSRCANSLAVALVVVSMPSCRPPGSDVEVEATILVVKKTPNDVLAPNTPISAPGYIEDYISTQMVLIRSPAIIGRALKMPNLAFLTDGDVQTVRNALTVRREGDKDNLITITWKGADADKGKLILDAVLVAYQNFLDETYKNVSDRYLELIIFARTQLKDNLMRSEQELMDFRSKNPSMTRSPDLTRTTMSALEGKKAANLASRAELEGRLAWAEKAVADKNDMLAFQLKVNEWATRSGFDKLPKESRQGLEPQQAYISVLKQDLAENQAIQKHINEAINAEQLRIRDLNNYEIVDERLRNTVAANRALFDSIVKRLHEVNLVKDFGGYEARQVAPPRVKSK